MTADDIDSDDDADDIENDDNADDADWRGYGRQTTSRQLTTRRETIHFQGLEEDDAEDEREGNQEQDKHERNTFLVSLHFRKSLSIATSCYRCC